VVDPDKCVSRIASRASLREDEEEGLEYSKKQKRLEYRGQGSDGLAAAALYVSCTLEGEDKTSATSRRPPGSPRSR